MFEPNAVCGYLLLSIIKLICAKKLKSSLFDTQYTDLDYVEIDLFKLSLFGTIPK